MTTDKPQRVLIAEDDDEFRAALCEGFENAGYQVTSCRHGLDLVRELRGPDSSFGEDGYHLIVSDIRMPGVMGLSVLAGLRDVEGVPPIILITAFGDAETHAEAQKLGAAAMLDKPFAMNDLLSVARETIASRT